MREVTDPNLLAQLEQEPVLEGEVLPAVPSNNIGVDTGVTQAANQSPFKDIAKDIVSRAKTEIDNKNKQPSSTPGQNNTNQLKPVTDPNVLNQLEKNDQASTIETGSDLKLTGFNDVLAETIGLPVDIITSVMNKMGSNIKNPVGGSESIKGVLADTHGPAEAVTTIATGAAAEPLAGLAGLAQTLNPLADEGAGAKAVEATRDFITVEPTTETGKDSLEAIGNVVEPVSKAFKATEDFLGDKTMEATGSPALAAAAKTIPTALAEAVGFVGAKGVFKAKKVIDKHGITKEIKDAAPTVDQLKDTARSVYKEIDDLNVTIHPIGYQSLVKKLNKIAKEGGLDADITPDAAKALKRFNDRIGDSITLTELDTLRKVAENAAGSIKPPDARLGVLIKNAVDDFLDQAKPQIFNGPADAVSGVGKRYKVARELWGRARRSELLDEAFEKARNQASGFENGVRTQFRSILNNKKKRRFFNEDELHIMTKVVRGGKSENIAKLIGRLGFSEGGATNVVGTSLGIFAGASVAGGPGAVLVPLVGQVSRKLAQRMTANNAKFADQVVRAGKDARKITKAYLDNTPKAERSASELSELLMKKDIDLSDVPDNVISIDAAKITKERRAALAAGATTGAVTSSSSARDNKSENQ